MSGSKWDDLKPRVLSAIVMTIVAGAAVWAGGYWFIALIAISSGLMIWELLRMIAPDRPGIATGMGIAAAVMLVLSLWGAVAIVLLIAIPAAGMAMLRDKQLIYGLYALAIMVAGYGFIYLRQELGLTWMLWMLLVVIASDIGGYAAGRLLGGPKFWPAVSPKKTWSGTIAGWIGAAVVGGVFGAGVLLPLVSVLVAFAAQMGDIAESAIKRKCGIKDSSNLIPGHGGFMDRFDGMLGASVLVMLLVLTGFPYGAG